MAELTLGAAVDPDDAAAVRAWTAKHGLASEDATFLCEHGIGRLLVYRSLVRSTLRDAVECSIPRTMARLGPLFDEWFARFLAERSSESHYLRDVALELLDWCEPRWAEDLRVPPWSADLGRHEALRIEIGALPVPPAPRPPSQLDLEKPVRFIEAARVAGYRFRVHELPEGLDDRSEPGLGPTSLFVYRSPEHEVRYLELTPLAGAILCKLLGGRMPLGAAVRAACAEAGAALDAAVIEGTAALLADLAERGALCGAEP